jgi:hypothetical protein
MPLFRTPIALFSLLLALAGPVPALGANTASCLPTTAKLAFMGLEARFPTTWTIVPPETSKRLAQFKIAKPGEGTTAEVIIFYFGIGQGGTAAANIERWRGQFIATKRRPVTSAVDHFQSNGMTVTTAELRGAYARGIGVGPVGTPKLDQILLAAIVESPRGNLIVQLHGAATAVKEQKKDFLAFVKSIRDETI